MWTTENRPRYDRDRLRYPSDLTDEEWSLVEPLNSSGQAWRSQTRGGGAGGGERGDVCAEHRLPVAIHPQGSAATEHATRLPDPVELRWDDREDPLCAVCAMPRGNRSGGQPDSLRD